MNDRPSWTGLIQQAKEEKKLLGATCCLYLESTNVNISSEERKCSCGRNTRKHSFSGEVGNFSLSTGDAWERYKHAAQASVTVFGMLHHKIKFVRFDHKTNELTDGAKPDTSLSTIGDILIEDAAKVKPTLLISCYGGEKYFQMNDKLEKEFMIGIGKAAATEGVWLLGTGLNSGVSKVIGQSVWRHKLLTDKPINSTVIGLTSWGCLSSRTRAVLRRQAHLNRDERRTRRESIVKSEAVIKAMGTGIHYSDDSLLLDEKQALTIETNYTHLILLDDGSEGSHPMREEQTGRIKNDRFYIDDEPRSEFVDILVAKTECHTVTILIEGGLDSLDVIDHDLHTQPTRPVVIVGGSGRLANALERLLELTQHNTPISNDVIDRYLRKVDSKKDLETYRRKVKEILKTNYRPYLTVFKLDDNKSFTDTIFSAVFKAQKRSKNSAQTTDQSGKKREPLVELLELSVKWNFIDGIDYLFENKHVMNANPILPVKLFAKALTDDRPVFIDYFLRRQYDVLDTREWIEKREARKQRDMSKKDSNRNLSGTRDYYTLSISQTPENEGNRFNDSDINDRARLSREFLVKELYGNPIDHLEKYGKIGSLADLETLYYRLIGPYTRPFFHKQSATKRFRVNCRHLWRWIFTRCLRSQQCPEICCCKPSKIHPDNETYVPKNFGHPARASHNEEMLRDLFLWSVISGHAEMSFILLLQVKSRLTASLIAAGMTSKFCSKKTGYLDQQHNFEKRANDYELFAKSCIDQCYEQNERLACQLLLRRTPLFGNVTCMQVAIHFRLQKFINTRCFDQVLNRQWNGALKQTTNETLSSIICFITSIIFLGLPAPWLLDYRNDDINTFKEEEKEEEEENSDSGEDEKKSSGKRKCHVWEGIKDKNFDDLKFHQKIREFHRTPIVRMTYHFLFYIWMLLVFSYMMLFKMRTENQRTHWSEIYVIITISAMLIEDILKVTLEYCAQMLERWHRSDLWMILLYILPYILFYIGIALKYASINQPSLLTPARIVLALDLELWYLFSLRFVSAIKLLGPKLFMIRNMLRDLVAFVYIIFVCMAAYGVVSRSLTMYDQIEFTAKNLSTAILYRPYWFLYSIVDEERDDFNDITGSTSSSPDAIAEATTNQILLTFHMLFINILVLNLLIAVFNFTITEVQEKSEFLWRYQRYELIREYFEKPSFAYPPLSLIVYLYPIVKGCFYGKNVFRIFKRLGTAEMHKHWTDFENVATLNFTRTFVDRMYRDRTTLSIPSLSEKEEWKAEAESLKRQNKEMRYIIDQMDIQSKKTALAINWMMEAMNRVKMPARERREPPFVSLTTSDGLMATN